MINEAESHAIEALAVNYDNAGFMLTPKEGELLAPLTQFFQTAVLTRQEQEFKSLGTAISHLSREIIDFDQVSSHSNAVAEFLDPIVKSIRYNNELARNTIMPIVKKIAEDVNGVGGNIYSSELNVIRIRKPDIVKLSVVAELLEKYSDTDIPIPKNPIRYKNLSSAELMEIIKIGIPEYDSEIDSLTNYWGDKQALFLDAYTAIYLNRETTTSKRFMGIIQATMNNNVEKALAFLVLAIGFNAHVIDDAGVSLEDYRSYSLLMLQSSVSCFMKALKEHETKANSGLIYIDYDVDKNTMWINGDAEKDDWVSSNFLEGYIAGGQSIVTLTMAQIKEKEDYYKEIGNRLREEKRLVLVKRRDAEILSILYKKILAVYDELPQDVILYKDKDVCSERLAEAMKKLVMNEASPNISRLVCELVCETYVPHTECKGILSEIRSEWEISCGELATEGGVKKPSLSELAVRANMRILARWLVQYIVKEPRLSVTPAPIVLVKEEPAAAE